MHRVVIGRLDDAGFAQRFAPSMFRMRYRVFHERLRWQVKCRGDWEIDEFDDSHSRYLLVTDAQDQLLGSWRLRCTTRPYMLADIFPELLDHAPAPRGLPVWEISRFAVDPDNANVSAFGFNAVARELVRATIQHAVDERIDRYVMVVSVAVERLLRNMGLVLHRYAPPRHIGRVRSVACWLEIDAHTRHVILGHPLDDGWRTAA